MGIGFVRTLRGKVGTGTGNSNTQPSSPASTRGEQGLLLADTTLLHSRLKHSPPEYAAGGPQPAAQGPPGLLSDNPPPYHDWMSVPDTALLPPPPAFPQQASSTNNASYQSAEAAHEWCDQNRVYTPSVPNQALRDAVAAGQLDLLRPPASVKNFALKQIAPGTWRCRTKQTQSDVILLSNLPLYFASVDSPLRSGVGKVIYYELKVLAINDPQSGIAIGFAAKPYPPWRLPGWHRASLAVHGDDGRRFVNDSWGGRDFVGPFQVGDVVGLGIHFLPQELGGEMVKTKAFFTRNGAEEGRWDLDEERDAEMDQGIFGLQGELDQYPAVGVFGGVELEVCFRKDEWRYRPV
ncbi:hypothetical protein DV735_g2106, partial [Chaetothyriales sp. CBS 134920]